MAILTRLPHIRLTGPRASSRSRHAAENVSRREVRSNGEQCLGRGPASNGQVARQTYNRRWVISDGNSGRWLSLCKQPERGQQMPNHEEYFHHVDGHPSEDCRCYVLITSQS